MTAEIAIFNRQAVVLAADSAVTSGRNRVWKHTNKLFTLGPQNDLAIMIYGAGELAGMPWEVIIKTFRAECSKRFETTKECGSAFIEFLADSRIHADDTSRIIGLLIFLKPLNTFKELMPEFKKKRDFRQSLTDICN